MGKTIAEKAFSRHGIGTPDAKAGDLVDARVSSLMVRNWHRVRALFADLGFRNGPPVVWDKARAVVVIEHNQPPLEESSARRNLDARRDAARLGLEHFYDSELGIGQQMMMDYGHVRPGDLVVGNDSHTIACGALNAVATGIGYEEQAYVFAFGELFFTVPQSIKVTLHGKKRSYPFGKDVILYLAGKYGDDFAQNHSLEFLGPLASEMDLATRLTLADHAVEVGAKFGIFLADGKTFDFVKPRTRVPFEPIAPDPDAQYLREIDVDCDQIGFQVAKPFRFDNVGPVEEVAGTRIDQARIGSCANGRFEDIEIAARMLEGRKVAPGVRFYISPASMSIYQQCADAGLIGKLIRAGVQFEHPGCSICDKQVVLNEEVCITSTTRNYRGRMGGPLCSEAQIYLASPATVTAAAIAGEIVNPREFLGGRA